jgi:hypothetical protein
LVTCDLCLQQELCSDGSDKRISLQTRGSDSSDQVLEQVKGTASICLGSKLEKPGECCTESPENSEAKLEADSVESSLKVVSELTLEHVEPESLSCNTCFVKAFEHTLQTNFEHLFNNSSAEWSFSKPLSLQ